MAKTTKLLVPTATVPMAPQIRCILWYDDQMSNAHIDHTVASGTNVTLACLIGLDGMHEVLVEAIE